MGLVTIWNRQKLWGYFVIGQKKPKILKEIYNLGNWKLRIFEDENYKVMVFII